MNQQDQFYVAQQNLIIGLRLCCSMSSNDNLLTMQPFLYCCIIIFSNVHAYMVLIVCLTQENWNRIILVIAFSMLIAGALSNSHSRADCGVSHHRFLSIGGVLCFLHGLFAVAYYISATATLAEEKKLNEAAPVTAWTFRQRQ